jgi:beta-N-acetylhexosaminidase
MKAQSDLASSFGQLFIMAFDGLQPQPEVLEFLIAFNIGGVILFADNYSDPEQLRSLTSLLQQRCGTRWPLFITTDHEGGRVQRFRRGFTAVPPMAKCGTGPTSKTEALHREVARELRAVGINLNFAPVADLCSAEQAGAIGDRSFGTEPVIVAEHVRAAIAGLQGEGVVACAKHFPGHGFTVQDSHHELPYISRSQEDLWNVDLVPFRAAIDAGVEAIMTAHAVYPHSADPDGPASLSSVWIRNILREQMGFGGIVVTDAIEMKGLMTRWSPETCGYRALLAGSDVLLYYREAHQFRAFDELRRALMSGEIPPSMVEQSLARIRKVKARYIKHKNAARRRPIQATT